MAKFNWDKVQTEHFAEKHGYENFSSDSLQAGYSSARSAFAPNLAICPHCNNRVAAVLLQNHYFICPSLRNQRTKIVKKARPKQSKKSKKAATKKIKSQTQEKKPKPIQKSSARINTPFKSLKDILQGDEPKQPHPLQGIKINQLKRKGV